MKYSETRKSEEQEKSEKEHGEMEKVERAEKQSVQHLQHAVQVSCHSTKCRFLCQEKAYAHDQNMVCPACFYAV